MRITKIEIKNFRAFYGTYQIDLHRAGKNLLVYGENGSGKSSLYLALKSFLESSEDNSIAFENYQNIFTTSDPGYIKLHLRNTPESSEHVYEWSRDVKETAELQIINAAKSKGFLDYKALLHTHYLHYENDTVNVFDLLIESLLANVTSDVTGLSIAEEWENLSDQSASQPDIEILEGQLEVFNREFADRLAALEAKASEILQRFGYNVLLKLDFQRITYNPIDETLSDPEIPLKVKFFDKDIPAHHRFLNEAKLSAIALAIYFAGILLQPDSDLKILALDDVLIGLDMSNRLPVLRILNDYFSDYQIFLTTYDKAWYEIVKQRTSHGGQWKAVEFYFSQTDEYEIPVCTEDKPYLKKAKACLKENDYKACAVYLRTAFEIILGEFCEGKHLSIKYHRNPNKQDSQNLWDAIKVENKKRVSQNRALLDQTLINDIEQYRTRLLNELCHATFANIYRKELEDAIAAVERLETALA